jgi:5-methylcytosine-specific restriction endonuclease McrBC regulatory subunit McrC
VELTENAPPVPTELTPSGAVRLAEASLRWQKLLKLREEPLRVTPAQRGKYLLQARGVAGFIRVGDVTFEIAPKFLNRESCGAGWRAAMWRFLAYGYGIEALSDASGKESVTEGIADILADLFLKSLLGASARGYPLGYRVRRRESLFLRGRLDPKRFARLVPITDRIGIIASELSSDIPTNRLLKWAALELAATVEEPARRRALVEWTTELPHVRPFAPLSSQVPLPRRQHPYLVHAVELAKLLLDDRRLDYDVGSFNLPGFLWDSENLFERASRRLLIDAARLLGLAAFKERHVLASTTSAASKSFTETTPDITIRSSTKPLFVADAKYKLIGDHPLNEDFYQVMAAGRVLAVPNVALIYPSLGRSITSTSYKPEGAGDPINVVVARIGLEAFSSRVGIRSLRQAMKDWLEPFVRQ